MIWEVISFSNTSSLNMVFNGIAAIFNDGAYTSAATVIMLFAVIGSVIQSLGAGKPELPFGRLLAGFIIYSMGFGTLQSVSIENRYDGTVTRIDNIPVAIAMPASLISNIGLYLTETMETAFGSPNDQYRVSANGYLSPLRVLTTYRTISLNSCPAGETASTGGGLNLCQTMPYYISECAMIGVTSNNSQYALYENDFLTAIEFDSKAHATKVILADGSSSVMDCKTAYTTIAGALNSVTFENMVKSHDDLLNVKIGEDGFILTEDAIGGVGGDSGKARNFLTTLYNHKALEDGELAFYRKMGANDIAENLQSSINQRNYGWVMQGEMFVQIVNKFLGITEAIIYGVTPFIGLMLLTGALGTKTFILYLQVLAVIQLIPALLVVAQSVVIDEFETTQAVLASKYDTGSVSYAIELTDKAMELMGFGGLISATIVPAMAMAFATGSGMALMGSLKGAAAPAKDTDAMPDTIDQGGAVVNLGNRNTAELGQFGNAWSNSARTEVGGGPTGKVAASNVTSRAQTAMEQAQRTYQSALENAHTTANGNTWTGSQIQTMSNSMGASNTEFSQFQTQLQQSVAQQYGLSNEEASQVVSALSVGLKAAGSGGEMGEKYTDGLNKQQKEAYNQIRSGGASDGINAQFQTGKNIMDSNSETITTNNSDMEQQSAKRVLAEQQAESATDKYERAQKYESLLSLNDDDFKTNFFQKANSDDGTMNRVDSMVGELNQPQQEFYKTKLDEYDGGVNANHMDRNTAQLAALAATAQRYNLQDQFITDVWGANQPESLSVEPKPEGVRTEEGYNLSPPQNQVPTAFTQGLYNPDSIGDEYQGYKGLVEQSKQNGENQDLLDYIESRKDYLQNADVTDDNSAYDFYKTGSDLKERGAELLYEGIDNATSAGWKALTSGVDDLGSLFGFEPKPAANDYEQPSQIAEIPGGQNDNSPKLTQDHRPNTLSNAIEDVATDANQFLRNASSEIVTTGENISNFLKSVGDGATTSTISEQLDSLGDTLDSFLIDTGFMNNGETKSEALTNFIGDVGSEAKGILEDLGFNFGTNNEGGSASTLLTDLGNGSAVADYATTESILSQHGANLNEDFNYQSNISRDDEKQAIYQQALGLGFSESAASEATNAVDLAREYDDLHAQLEQAPQNHPKRELLENYLSELAEQISISNDQFHTDVQPTSLSTQQEPVSSLTNSINSEQNGEPAPQPASASAAPMATDSTLNSEHGEQSGEPAPQPASASASAAPMAADSTLNSDHSEQSSEPAPQPASASAAPMAADSTLNSDHGEQSGEPAPQPASASASASAAPMAADSTLNSDHSEQSSEPAPQPASASASAAPMAADSTLNSDHGEQSGEPAPQPASAEPMAADSTLNSDNGEQNGEPAPQPASASAAPMAADSTLNSDHGEQNGEPAPQPASASAAPMAADSTLNSDNGEQSGETAPQPASAEPMAADSTLNSDNGEQSGEPASQPASAEPMAADSTPSSDHSEQNGEPAPQPASASASASAAPMAADSSLSSDNNEQNGEPAPQPASASAAPMAADSTLNSEHGEQNGEPAPQPASAAPMAADSTLSSDNGEQNGEPAPQPASAEPMAADSTLSSDHSEQNGEPAPQPASAEPMVADSSLSSDNNEQNGEPAPQPASAEPMAADSTLNSDNGEQSGEPAPQPAPAEPMAADSTLSSDNAEQNGEPAPQPASAEPMAADSTLSSDNNEQNGEPAPQPASASAAPMAADSTLNSEHGEQSGEPAPQPASAEPMAADSTLSSDNGEQNGEPAPQPASAEPMAADSTLSSDNAEQNGEAAPQPASAEPMAADSTLSSGHGEQNGEPAPQPASAEPMAADSTLSSDHSEQNGEPAPQPASASAAPMAADSTLNSGHGEQSGEPAPQPASAEPMAADSTLNSDNGEQSGEPAPQPAPAEPMAADSTLSSDNAEQNGEPAPQPASVEPMAADSTLSSDNAEQNGEPAPQPASAEPMAADSTLSSGHGEQNGEAAPQPASAAPMAAESIASAIQNDHNIGHSSQENMSAQAQNETDSSVEAAQNDEPLAPESMGIQAQNETNSSVEAAQNDEPLVPESMGIQAQNETDSSVETDQNDEPLAPESMGIQAQNETNSSVEAAPNDEPLAPESMGIQAQNETDSSVETDQNDEPLAPESMGIQAQKETDSSVEAAQNDEPLAPESMGIQAQNETNSSVEAAQNDEPLVPESMGIQAQNETDSSVETDQNDEPLAPESMGIQAQNETDSSVETDQNDEPLAPESMGIQAQNETDSSVEAAQNDEPLAPESMGIQAQNETNSSVEAAQNDEPLVPESMGIQAQNETDSSVEAAQNDEPLAPESSLFSSLPDTNHTSNANLTENNKASIFDDSESKEQLLDSKQNSELIDEGITNMDSDLGDMSEFKL